MSVVVFGSQQTHIFNGTSKDMTPEKVREARLRRLDPNGGSSASPEKRQDRSASISMDEQKDVEPVQSMSVEVTKEVTKEQVASEPVQSMSVEKASPEGKVTISAEELTQMNKVIYRGGGATEEDMRRWYEQGFAFSKDTKVRHTYRQTCDSG